MRLIFPVALDGNATVAITKAETLLLLSANESVSTCESVASLLRTHILVINGFAHTVCNGPICHVQKKDPPRPCHTCSYQYCKKCCLHYQEKTQKYCKEARHACVPNPSETAPTTTSPLASETGTGMTMTSEFQLNKPNPSNYPLCQEHYEAQQRSECEWRVEANRLTLQKAVEERLKWNVNICFWNSVSLGFVTHTCWMTNQLSPRMKLSQRYSPCHAPHFLCFHWRTVPIRYEKHWGWQKTP